MRSALKPSVPVHNVKKTKPSLRTEAMVMVVLSTSTRPAAIQPWMQTSPDGLSPGSTLANHSTALFIGNFALFVTFN